MVTFSAFYQWQQNHETLRLYAPDYVDSCLNCATPNEESCVWTMSALTSVIGTPIKSIYPAVNGQEDRAISALNTQFSPRVVKEDQKQEDAIKILWSTKKPAKTPVPPGTWVPDHFVPLVEVRSIQLSPVMTSLHPSRVSGRKRKPTAKLLETIKSESGNTSLHMEVTVDDEDAPESDISGLDLEGQSPSKTKRRKKMIMVDETMDFDWQRKYTHDAVGGKPITGSGFMPIKDVFQVLTKAKDPLPSIPRGRKNDVYFVVDNSRNTRHPTRRNYFSDDCGLYKQRCGTTCKNWYLYKDGTICALNKVGGKYCKETKLVTKTVQGKPVKEVTWIPMDPQPEASSLILLHRYYAMLQCDPYYRRRISWFSVLPPSVEGGKDIMLVEYLNKPRAGRSRAVSSGPIHDTDSEDAETSIAEEGAKKNSLAAQAEEMEKGGESGTQPSKTTSAENSVDKHYSKETPTEKTDTNEEADKAESNEKEVDKIVSTEKDDDKPESAEKESDTTESAEKESDKTESPEKETSKVQIRKTTRSRK
ncbi:hypothetical protein BaRGS_00028558 [Batillaria attramentaria]|uniref:Uncharacterized protein n=1 Tax=Batillaria attramentaria TaxID=370345 RepID=A0ABD0JZE1_9CAEN